MRIIQVAGPSHREDGPPLYWLKALNQIPGISCERKTLLDPVDKWGEWHLCLHVDWGGDCFPNLPPHPYPHPSVCVSSDTHWTKAAYDWRLNQAKQCSMTCCNQANATEQFAKDGVKNVYWLPHAADHTVYTPILKDYKKDRFDLPPEPKSFDGLTAEAYPKWDVSFVGFLGDPGRREKLDKIFKVFPNFNLAQNVFFEDASIVYGRSAVSLNISVRGELNMRTFEVLASRAFLLTDYQLGMDELGLKDGEHLAWFRTTEEAIEKATYYIDRPKKRREVAQNGWEWFLKGHTHLHRAHSLLHLLSQHSDLPNTV